MVGNVPGHVSNSAYTNYNMDDIISFVFFYLCSPGTDTLAIFISNSIPGQVTKHTVLSLVSLSNNL